MNPLQKLCETLRASSEFRACGAQLDVFWDEPQDREKGVWFVDLITNNGQPDAKHFVVEWRPTAPGFGVTFLVMTTKPFDTHDAIVKDEAEAVAWIVQRCAPKT